jgi:hypothetical protein
MLPFSFSTGLDPEHHRQAVSIEKLTRDYGCTSEELLEAAAKETKGYFFKLEVEVPSRWMLRGLRQRPMRHRPVG